MIIICYSSYLTSWENRKRERRIVCGFLSYSFNNSWVFSYLAEREERSKAPSQFLLWLLCDARRFTTKLREILLLSFQKNWLENDRNLSRRGTSKKNLFMLSFPPLLQTSIISNFHYICLKLLVVFFFKKKWMIVTHTCCFCESATPTNQPNVIFSNCVCKNPWTEPFRLYEFCFDFLRQLMHFSLVHSPFAC